MFDTASPEIQFVIKIADQATSLAQHIKNETSDSAFQKKDQSPVTVADFSIQAVSGYWLDQYFAKDAFVAEESSDLLKKPEGQDVLRLVTHHVNRHIPNSSSEQICDWIDRGSQKPKDRFWTLDPVDGTKGYIRGGQYAMAMALVDKGEVQVGALACPNLNGQLPHKTQGGSLIIAVRDQGSWITSLKGPKRFSRISVSDCSDSRQARILRSFESKHTDADQTAALWKTLGVQTDPILMDSQAKHAMVAAGGADLFFHLLPASQRTYRISIWDQAAGSLIVEEAGGRVTDLAGKKFDFSTGKKLQNNFGVVISNGKLHQKTLDAIRKVGVHLQ